MTMHTAPLGRVPFALDPFGQIHPHINTRHRLRFMADDGGDGGAGGDGGEGGDGTEELADKGKQALDRMKSERNNAKAQLKAYADLGLTPEEVKELAAAKKAGEQLDEDKIRTEAEKVADQKATERIHAKVRSSAVRAEAAELGFIKPAQALALLDAQKLAEVDVNDDDEADADEIKKLLNALATDSPHLLKPTDTTPDWRAAGMGAGGSGAKPEVTPGVGRMAHAFQTSSSTRGK
jgi:hypothetical protein